MGLSAAFPYRLRPILYPDKADIRRTWTIVRNVRQQPIISQLLTPIRRTLAGKKAEALVLRQFRGKLLPIILLKIRIPCHSERSETTFRSPLGNPALGRRIILQET